MSRNYYCPFPTVDYASSFNASLEYDRVANKWRINVSASRRCIVQRISVFLSFSLSPYVCIVCARTCRAESLHLVTAFLRYEEQLFVRR